MEEIDKPFRPRWDFILVWAILAISIFIYRDKFNDGLPWYSVMAFVIVVPFILTFFVYGPMLLVRQVIKSGSRGRFVLADFFLLLGPAIVICGVLLITGYDRVAKGMVFPLLFFGIFCSLLHYKKQQRNS
jgi:hypothetical protein